MPMNVAFAPGIDHLLSSGSPPKSRLDDPESHRRNGILEKNGTGFAPRHESDHRNHGANWQKVHGPVVTNGSTVHD